MSRFVSSSLSPAVTASQTDVKKSKTDASKQEEKSQMKPDETHHATTTVPRLAVSALPNTPTPQPRAAGVVGRGGPIAVPAPRNDSIIVSEYDFLCCKLFHPR